MNEIEQAVRGNFRIWTNPSHHGSKQYRFVVYYVKAAEAQFKKEEHAKLYMEARIQQEVEKVRSAIVGNIGDYIQ